MLIEHLPSDAATIVAQAPELQWTRVEQLLAAAVDELRVANWQRSVEGVPKGRRPKPPKPIERPGVTGPKRMGTARPMAEVRALLDRWKRGDR